MSDFNPRSMRRGTDRYGRSDFDEANEGDNYMLQQHDEVPQRQHSRKLNRPGQRGAYQSDVFRDEDSDGGEDDGFEMSLSELLYSTSSFYAIIVPGEKPLVLQEFLSALPNRIFSDDHNGFVGSRRSLYKHRGDS